MCKVLRTQTFAFSFLILFLCQQNNNFKIRKYLKDLHNMFIKVMISTIMLLISQNNFVNNCKINTRLRKYKYLYLKKKILSINRNNAFYINRAHVSCDLF